MKTTRCSRSPTDFVLRDRHIVVVFCRPELFIEGDTGIYGVLSDDGNKTWTKELVIWRAGYSMPWLFLPHRAGRQSNLHYILGCDERTRTTYRFLSLCTSYPFDHPSRLTCRLPRASRLFELSNSTMVSVGQVFAMQRLSA